MPNDEAPKIVEKKKERAIKYCPKCVGQQMSFGRKVCRSSGRSGSAENVVTGEHSFWKMGIWP